MIDILHTFQGKIEPMNHIETHFVGIDYQCKYCISSFGIQGKSHVEMEIKNRNEILR